MKNENIINQYFMLKIIIKIQNCSATNYFARQKIKKYNLLIKQIFHQYYLTIAFDISCRLKVVENQ